MRSYHEHNILVNLAWGQQRVEGLKRPVGALLLREHELTAAEMFAGGALPLSPSIGINRADPLEYKPFEGKNFVYIHHHCVSILGKL